MPHLVPEPPKDARQSEHLITTFPHSPPLTLQVLDLPSVPKDLRHHGPMLHPQSPLLALSRDKRERHKGENKKGM